MLAARPRGLCPQVPLGCGEGQWRRQWHWLGSGTPQEPARCLLVQSPLPAPPSLSPVHSAPAPRRLRPAGAHRPAGRNATACCPHAPCLPRSLPRHPAPLLQFLARPLTPPALPVAHPRTFAPQPGLGARLPHLPPRASVPSPLSIPVPTSGLGLPGVHRPGSRASRARTGHLAAAFAVSLWGRRTSERRSRRLHEPGREDARARSALGGRRGRRGRWRLRLQHRARGPFASLSAAAAPLLHRAPTGSYCSSSLLPLSI